MASKGTNSSSTLKRDLKKVTPSSSLRTVQRQGSSKITGPDSIAKDKASSSEKPTPSHLKPMISRKSESFKHVKKTGPDDSEQKATILRRRSFDKPPSLSRVHSSIISPTKTMKYVKKTVSDDSEQKATILRRRSFDKPPSVSSVHSSMVSPAKTMKNVKKTDPDDSEQKATILRRRSFDRPPSVSRVHSSIISPTRTMKYAKKMGPEDSAQKANLLRRRSFDKPPPITCVHSSPSSLDPKGRAAPDRTGKTRSTTATPKATSSQKSVLSTSTTTKATSSLKPVLERSSKTMKLTNKSLSPASRTVRRGSSFPRSTIHPTKYESDVSVPAITLHDTTQNLDVVCEVSEELALFDEIANSEDGMELLSDHELKLEDKDHEIDKEDVDEVRIREDEKLKTFEDTSPVSEAQIKPQATEAEAQTAESEMHTEDKGEEDQHEAEENQIKAEGSGNVPDEGVANEAKVEAYQEEKGENVAENVASSEDLVEEKNNEDKEHGNQNEELKLAGEEETLGDKIEEADQDTKPEGEPEAGNVAEKQQPVGRGRKETQAYNDVIEQTKNKLLELRKNKVRALVGAFETVIDHESSSK